MEWEEAEKILSWREMQNGVYSYHGIERRGINEYGRPISVVTLEREGVKRLFVIVLGPEKPSRNKLHQI